MLLYHGSNLDIQSISLAMCRPYKDFGTGYYLTDLQTQAENMAKRVSRIHGGTPIVNVYEIKNSFLHSPDLRIKNFGRHMSPEWAIFVMNNRSRTFTNYQDPACNLDNKYDIVAEPVADDSMAMLFRQFQNGLIDFDMLTKGMAYKELTSQYSFHTPRALQLLQKVGVL
jgi:hypothetical protein